MAIYDQYDEYRPMPTPAEVRVLVKAEEQRLLTRVGGNSEYVREVEGGFINREGEFVADPVVKVHMDIALKYAGEQLDGWPAMPEDESITLRFPGISPKGKYCAMDMLFAQRIARIEAALETQPPEVAAYVGGLLDLRKSKNLHMLNIMTGLEYQMSMSRQLSRASKLCHDPVGRRLLHNESRQMETDGMVRDYDLYLQGIEYAVGIDPRPELPAEVRDLYHDKLGRDLDPEMHRRARETVAIPPVLHVEFENLDDKLLHRVFSDPRNWGIRYNEAKALLAQETAQRAAMGLGDEELDHTVTPYARATADRVLHPLFERLEHSADSKLAISRGDYIIVDGQTVREKMTDEYLAAHGDLNGFDAHYAANVRHQANEYVAAALMAGKRVEAFVPDQFGHIPNEPVQIARAGYTPSPVQKVTLNAWERFFAKRGFYKEKVAKAAEYERFEEARNRVRQGNLYRTRDFDFNSPTMREAFFGDWSRANGGIQRPRYDNTNPATAGHNYSLDRSADFSLAVCFMAAQGYSPEDIFDPTKLQAERQRAGAEVMRHFEAYDHSWLMSTVFHGHLALLDYMDWTVQNKQLHIEDENVLFRDENRVLFAVAQTLFDSSQETNNAGHKLYEAAAERTLSPQEVAGLTPEQITEKATALAFQVHDRAATVSAYFDYAAKSLDARGKLASGTEEARFLAPDLGNILSFEALRRGYGAALWGKDSHAEPIEGYEYQKGKPITQCIDKDQLFKTTYAATTSTYRYVESAEMKTRFAANAGLARAFGHGLANGQLQKRFSFKVNTENLDQSTFHIDPPKKAATAAQLQQEQNQRNAPTAGGAGGRAR